MNPFKDYCFNDKLDGPVEIQHILKPLRCPNSAEKRNQMFLASSGFFTSHLESLLQNI